MISPCCRLNFFFCAFLICHRFCFCFFSCNLRHGLHLDRFWVGNLWAYGLILNKQFTLFAVSGEMAILATVETSLGSVTKVSSGSSVITTSESIVTATSVSAISIATSESSSVSTSVEISSAIASWWLNLDFLTVNFFTVHAKLADDAIKKKMLKESES